MESTEHQKIWWKIIYELTFLLLGVQAAQSVNITPRPGEKPGDQSVRSRTGAEMEMKIHQKWKGTS